MNTAKLFLPSPKLGWDFFGLERVVSLVVLLRQFQNAAGRDSQAGEAAVRLAVQPYAHRRTVGIEKVHSQGERCGAGIDEDKLSCPSTTGREFRNEHSAWPTNTGSVGGDRSRRRQIRDRERAEIGSSECDDLRR